MESSHFQKKKEEKVKTLLKRCEKDEKTEKKGILGKKIW